MAGGDPEHKPTIATADTLLAEDESNEEDRTVPGTGPFFRLPRELRDEIYDLSAMDEDTIYYDIALKADEPPQKTAYVHPTAGHAFANTQFEKEYACAIRDRTNALMIGTDRNGCTLVEPGPAVLRAPTTYMHDMHLEISKGKRSGGQVSQNIHALKVVIPIRPREADPRSASRMILSFIFSDKEELGPRDRVNICWNTSGVAMSGCGYALVFPPEDDSVLQQVLNISKEMNWKNSLREYMVWHSYIVKYARRGT